MKTLNTSPFRNLERSIIEKLCTLAPPFIGTKILTFLGLLSSAGILMSYYLCRRSYCFLFLASFFIIMEWIFDGMDGAIGRARDEGFEKWGYYMDHLFDYFFLASVVFGIYFLFPRESLQVLLLFFITSAYMVSFFLMHDASDEPEFKISFWNFSPIEFRLLGVLVREPGRVFSRVQLIDKVFGYDFEGFDRTVDVHILNLRRKIEPDPNHPRYIKTLYGAGYKFAEGVE